MTPAVSREDFLYSVKAASLALGRARPCRACGAGAVPGAGGTPADKICRVNEPNETGRFADVSVNAVNTASDVSTVVRLMREDLTGHPDAWENSTLDRFLEALEAVLVDHAGDVSAPTWAVFAELLVTATGYE